VLSALVGVAWACWPQVGCELPSTEVASHVSSSDVHAFVVGGHGNGSRNGNTGVYQQVEADVALSISTDLAGALASVPGIRTTLGRTVGERPSYETRLERLVDSGADCLLDIHTDSRPEYMYEWVDDTGTTVWRNDRQAGFAVLFNESGPLGSQRRELARALALELAEAGLPPYTLGYGPTYDADRVPGVYIDRRGLMMLRAPGVPSVIIESHHALDVWEAARWREERTRQVFAVGVANGLFRWRHAAVASRAD